MTKRTKEQALAELLATLFPTPNQFQLFLLSLPGGKSLLSFINLSSPILIIAFNVVDQIRTRGLIDADFFERLQEQAPQNKEIPQVREEWLINIDSWTKPPTSEVKTSKSTKAPVVFVYYSRRDSSFYEELITHLSLLERKGVINIWHEGRIRAGDQWTQIINSQLAEADILILLVSPDLLSSEFLWSQEFRQVQDAQSHKKGGILPILVRPCDWQDTPIAGIMEISAGGPSVSESDDPDRIWVEVSNYIARLAKNWGASL
jgi:TIR domain